MVNFYSKKINQFFVVDVPLPLFAAPLIPSSAAVEWSSVPRLLVVPLGSSWGVRRKCARWWGPKTPRRACPLPPVACLAKADQSPAPLHSCTFANPLGKEGERSLEWSPEAPRASPGLPLAAVVSCLASRESQSALRRTGAFVRQNPF